MNGKRSRSDVGGTGDLEEPVDFAVTQTFL